MAVILQATTKLEAVNTMLFTIGESPVNTLSGSQVVDAVTAEQTLDRISREVQSEGWAFNTDTGFPLKVQAFDPYYIYVPGSVLECDPCDKDSDLVVRGDRLYDRANHTFTFPIGTTVECDITWLFQFNELPESARNYITIRAARVFQAGAVGSDLLDGFTQRDEFAAMRRFKRHNAKVRDKNLLKNTAVGRILAR